MRCESNRLEMMMMMMHRRREGRQVGASYAWRHHCSSGSGKEADAGSGGGRTKNRKTNVVAMTDTTTSAAAAIRWAMHPGYYDIIIIVPTILLPPMQRMDFHGGAGRGASERKRQVLQFSILTFQRSELRMNR